MTRLVFLDTETTGLEVDADIWEVALIVRDPDMPDVEIRYFLEHDTVKCSKLPERFLADHRRRFPISIDSGWHADVLSRGVAARKVYELTAGAHIVGAVPNFDTERLALLLARFGLEPAWHYHLVDVENLAVGWLHGAAAVRGEPTPDVLALPWDSDKVSDAIGVTSPEETRHTALGDARWARDVYDAVTGSRR